ncbi:MAG TPA: hypothetical protein VM030_04770 [Acidimicrobiales bacterium]|nr:hypothetical protein [Acidimicrobiales bacterium]
MSDAVIHDRGYRPYDGPRLGQVHAVKSLTLHTLQRIFGLRRQARSKALPFIVVVLAYLPAIVFVGLSALLPKALRDATLPTYEGYYGFVSGAIILFVAFVAPEALCPDRRSRSLSLYLAALLDRTTYLVAKALAIFLTLLTVTVGPVLLLVLGLSIQNAGPDGLGELAIAVGRILAAGTSLSLFFTAVSLALSSLTDRRAVASATTIGVLIGSGIVAAVLEEALKFPDAFLLLSLNTAPYFLVNVIYGVTMGREATYEIPTLIIPLAVAAWTVAGFGFAWLRYQRLQVTR